MSSQTHKHTHPAGPGGVRVHPRPFDNRNASRYEGEGVFFFLFTSGAEAH